MLQILEHGIMRVADALEIRNRLIAHVVQRLFVGLHLLADGLNVGLPHLVRLRGQIGKRLLVQIVQTQLCRLRVLHDFFHQMLRRLLLDLRVQTVGSQIDAVLLGIHLLVIGILFEHVVQENRAAIVFNDYLRVVIGLVKLDLRLQLGNACLKVFGRFRKRQRAEAGDCKEQAKYFLQHWENPPHDHAFRFSESSQL